jgi:CRP/FNR family transcriptional regulator
MKVHKRQTIFEEGEPPRNLFVVINGVVKLSKFSDEGKEIVIRVMRAGDYFCCAPIFSLKRHFVTATALEDTELLLIDSQSFVSVLHEGLNDLGKKVLNSLCSRIGHLSNMIETLIFNNVEMRIIITLKQIAQGESPDNEMVRLSLSHQDIASLVGTVREVVSRTMSRLKQEGAIVCSTVKGFTLNVRRLDDILKERVMG